MSSGHTPVPLSVHCEQVGGSLGRFWRSESRRVSSPLSRPAPSVGSGAVQVSCSKPMMEIVSGCAQAQSRSGTQTDTGPVSVDSVGLCELTANTEALRLFVRASHRTVTGSLH